MAGVLWSWQRGVSREDETAWIERLKAAGHSGWSFTERPDRVRIQLQICTPKRVVAERLWRDFGGRIAIVKQEQWLSAVAREPLRVGGCLTIYDRKPVVGSTTEPSLIIPHGLAFGSGEHATTYMLLRELVRLPLSQRVLDLGTGSGILALAARRLGARHVVATDFDPAAIRTAGQNEAGNFRTPLIAWRQADVRKLRQGPRFHLVMANLFSELLIETAPRITACLARGGRLWLSGILRAQQDEVADAYGRTGLRLLHTRRRGKWVMLSFGAKPLNRPRAD